MDNILAHRISPASIVTCLLWAGLATWTTDASAAVVRGRLLRGAHSAGAGISVTVLNKASGASAPAVVTNPDGMYYIYNVKPGSYYLQVWASGVTGKPMRYEISVAEPISDIPPIALP